MPIAKKFTDADFNKFQSDLLNVLKDEETGKLEFDGKLLVKSRRLGCTLAASDVHRDIKSGEIVLVGAFRSGQPIMDETVKYPKMKEYVSIPLKECFEDLKQTSGMEMRLISKARKAVIEKYLRPMLYSLQSRGLCENGFLDLTSLECGHFLLETKECIGMSVSPEGYINIMFTDSFCDRYRLSSEQTKLLDIQRLGRQLEGVQEKITQGMETYSHTMHELHPADTSMTERERKEYETAALIKVYESGLPIKICDAVAKTMAQSDMFDEKKHTRKEIISNIERIKKGRKGKNIRNGYANIL